MAIRWLLRYVSFGGWKILWLKARVGHGMPNGTLCGKAVAEMTLAEESGVAMDEVQDKLVIDGNLPKAYIITRERIERCRDIDSVQVQDQKGYVGIRSIDRMIHAHKSHKL